MPVLLIPTILEAAKGADVIEIKNWGRTMSEEEDLAGRSKLKMTGVFLKDTLKRRKRRLFMHCLPVERNQEATDERSMAQDLSSMMKLKTDYMCKKQS